MTSLSNVYADSVVFSINANNVITSTGTYSPAINFGIRYLLSNDTEIALCFVPKSVLSNNWGADYTGIIVTKEQNNNFTIGQTASSGYGGSYNQLKYSSNGVYVYQSSETGGQFWSASPTISINGVTTQLQVFNSLADVCSFYSNNWIVPVNKSYFQLQNGYVAVFDIGNASSYEIGLKGYSEELSTWLGNSFERTNQTYWFADSLPNENDSMPATPNTKIVWEEDEPKNIFGQTHYMKADLSGTSTGRYLYIYNPAVHLKVSGSGRNETQVKNSPLDISINPDITVYVYDTQGSLSLLNGGGLVGNVVGSYGVGASTSSGGAITFTDPENEQQYIQISGGSTDTSSIDDKSVQGFLQELKETLDYFVETIISLLSAPISHIKQLISAGSEFMNTLAGLFTWLPAPVTSVLVSALVVLVVVGVFKIFL